jgi:hypothetical protein
VGRGDRRCPTQLRSTGPAGSGRWSLAAAPRGPDRGVDATGRPRVEGRPPWQPRPSTR